MDKGHYFVKGCNKNEIEEGLEYLRMTELNSFKNKYLVPISHKIN